MLQQVRGPERDPVGLEEVKAHLRLDQSLEDEYLLHLIKVATEQIEASLERSLITQTWCVTAYQSEASSIHRLTKGEILLREITLPRPPLLNIERIEKIIPGREEGIPIKRYMLKTDSGLPRLVLFDPGDVVRVTYETGYGPKGSDVPSPIRQAILIKVASLYENREGGLSDHLNWIETLLAPYRIMGGLT